MLGFVILYFALLVFVLLVLLALLVLRGILAGSLCLLKISLRSP